MMINNSQELEENEDLSDKATHYLPPTQNNKRILTGVFALFLLLVGVILAYLAVVMNNTSKSPPSEPITTTPIVLDTDWITYSNQDLNFSVQHPSTWQTEEFSRDAYMGNSRGVLFRPINSEIVNDNWGLITIEVEDNQNNLTLDDFIDSFVCSSPGVCATGEDASSVIVSGVTGKKIINRPGPIPSQMVVLLYSDKIFTINVNLDQSLEEILNTQQKEEAFKAMLKTFKLIDKEETDGMS